MLLKITDSWGPGIAYLAIAVVTLAAVGLAAIIAAIVLLVVKLFRRKDRKTG